MRHSVLISPKCSHEWGDLRIDGYLKGQQVVSKTYSGRGVDQKFSARADDAELSADGADSTRVVFRVTDEFGAIRPYANDPIVLEPRRPCGNHRRQSVRADRRHRRHLDSRKRTGGNCAAHGQAPSSRNSDDRAHAAGSARRARLVSDFQSEIRRRTSTQPCACRTLIARKLMRPIIYPESIGAYGVCQIRCGVTREHRYDPSLCCTAMTLR